MNITPIHSVKSNCLLYQQVNGNSSLVFDISDSSQRAKKPAHNNNFPRSSYQKMKELPMMNTSAMYFTGAPKVVKNLKAQLALLDDVHCPVCGIEMLSKNKFDEILNNAANAKNLKEYVEIINQNKKYFPHNAERLIKFLNDISEKTPEKTIDETIAFARNGANRLIRKEFHQSAEFLEKTALEGSFSNEDLEKLDKGIILLKGYTGKKLPKYNDFKASIKKIIGSLETDKKWEIFTHIRNNMVKEYIYLGFLKYNTFEPQKLPEQVFLLKNILKNSTSKVNPSFLDPLDKRRGNNILMCNHCAGNEYKPFIAYVAQKHEILKNIKLHLEDIGKAVFDNKLNSNELYLADIIKMFNVAYGNKEVFTMADACAKIN